jgi:hypothetical protein
MYDAPSQKEAVMQIKISFTIRSPAELFGNARLRIAAFALMFVASGAFMAWPSVGDMRSADAANGNDFSIEIDANGDTVADCDTRSGGPGAKCFVSPGTMFTVQVSIDKLVLPNADGDGKSGYQGVIGRVDYSSGLTLKQRPGNDELVLGGCSIPFESKLTGIYATGCGVAPGQNEFTQTGKIIEVDFTCPVSPSGETVSLVHGLGGSDTQLVNESGSAVSNDPDAPSESLSVNCATPPTPAPNQVLVTNVGQYALPKACFDVRDASQTLLFVVCDNDFQGAPASHGSCAGDGVCEDEDAAEGGVAVSLSGASYRILESKGPPEHTSDSSKQICDATSASCSVTFVNSPTIRPWHPWDIVGDPDTGGPDGLVRIPDILAVITHYFDDKAIP